MARVQVLNETALRDPAQSGTTLFFQWCRYIHDDGQVEHGYRFISRRPSSEGIGQETSRGQARIPSVEVIERLVWQARREGWGDFDDDRISSSSEANWARGGRRSP